MPPKRKAVKRSAARSRAADESSSEANSTGEEQQLSAPQRKRLSGGRIVYPPGCQPLLTDLTTSEMSRRFKVSPALSLYLDARTVADASQCAG